MRIAYLIPGTGSFFCGTCLRDHALARGLRARGHDVTILPLYLPLVVESEEPEPDLERVFMGGINVYLQQKSALFRHLPRVLARWLDSPSLLRWSAARSNMTSAAEHAAMTLSMLQGEAGQQAAELDRLARWMARHDRPEVICLSNALLAGMSRHLAATTGARVVCSLQGEAPFLDALPQPYREQAWAALESRCDDVESFVAVSRYYGDHMRARLNLGPERVHVVPNGIELDGLVEEPAPVPGGAAPTIGYLARLCTDKGLHTLVDAFIELKRRGRVENLRLRAAGAMLPPDRDLVRELRARLDGAGFGGGAEFEGNVDVSRKLDLLRGITVLSVPATYGESFGLYVLEAMAAGVPVVQPRHGAFPEIIDATGGGLICEPDDHVSLADGLESLLLDPDRARELGRCGRQSVLDRFTAARMAAEVEAVLVGETSKRQNVETSKQERA